ncbi:MAG: hypothetical protein JW825_01685 [Candidatus Methanofastidiosa archaeon]|nr:hypothetical protein [Candidatus Methanofastidiosa archaeon]
MGNKDVLNCVIAIIAVANLLMALYYAIDGRSDSIEFILHSIIFMAFAGMALYYKQIGRNRQ